MTRLRGISTVASFAIFIVVFAVIILSVFYFYNFLLSATQKGLEAIYLAISREASMTSGGAVFTAALGPNGLTCRVQEGGSYYIVSNSTGGLVYNGSSPICPPAQPGLYTYRILSSNGAVNTVEVSVGGVAIWPYVNVSSIVVNDYNNKFPSSLYVVVTNPTSGYALLTNITASLYGPYVSCTSPTGAAQVGVAGAFVVPPGGSITVNVGTFLCSVNITKYIYVNGGPPFAVNVNVSAQYRGLTVATRNVPVATVSSSRTVGGYFNYTGSSCYIGPITSQPLYYVLLNGSTPILSGTPGTNGAVQCPPAQPGFYTYRAVLAGGAVLSVPVSIGRLYIWAEANRTTAYINKTVTSASFDLYLMFTNPTAGYTPVHYSYSLVYNTNLLSCSLVSAPPYLTCSGSVCSGNLTLAPAETRALYVGTYKCTATSAFFNVNQTTVAVKLNASYNGYTYVSGVIGQPTFSPALPANWVVLKILAGSSSNTPGASVMAFQQGNGLVSFIFISPYCPKIAYNFNNNSGELRFYTNGSAASYSWVSGSYIETKGVQNQFAAGFVNITRLVGSPIPATSSLSAQAYIQQQNVRQNNYFQLNFFIDLNGDGKPDVEVIYYGSGGGTTPAAIAKYIYGYTLPVHAYRVFTNIAGGTWNTLSIRQIYPQGRVVGVAFVSFSSQGALQVKWENLAITEPCSNT
ncbi:MAG: hypothetical protein QXP98_07855 [Thermoproteus sp.]